MFRQAEAAIMAVPGCMLGKRLLPAAFAYATMMCFMDLSTGQQHYMLGPLYYLSLTVSIASLVLQAV
jgi:hypothetical protein